MLYGLKHRDYRTINYTEDLDEAYKFCATHPGYEIIAAEKLKKDIDYNETEFIYRYIVSFNLSMDEKSYVMIKHLENEPEFNYCNCYTKNFEFHDSVGAYREGRRVYFNIFIRERNYSIACKIAEEYLNKLINMGNGKVTKENIELMNEELRIAKK